MTRALADEHVVPTPIQKRPFAIANRDVVGINRLDTVTAAVLTLPIHHHRAHEPIDRGLVFTQARDRADGHTQSRSAKASHSNASQIRHAIAGSRSGQASIVVVSDVAVRRKQVAGISHDVNCDVLEAPTSYMRRKGHTKRSSFRPCYSVLQFRRNVGAAGIEKQSGVSISRRIGEQFVPHNNRARRAPAIRTIGRGRRSIGAAGALRAPQMRTDRSQRSGQALTAVARPHPTTGELRFADVTRCAAR
jgi:superfamily II DNA/RNA helicase